MADQGRGVQIRYPTSVLAGALKKEGMDAQVVSALAAAGHCRVGTLTTLAGQTLTDLGRVTKGLGLKDARNVQYIRAALIKLRIEIPPAADEKSSSYSSLASLAASDASSLTLSERLPTTTSAPRAAPVSSNNPAAAVPSAAKPSANMTEHERMLLILRDFPMAYEQYVRENGGPSLYPGARAAILAPAGAEKGETEESRLAASGAAAAAAGAAATAGAAGAATGAVGAAATSPPRVVVHTSEGAVGLLCGAAGTGEGFSLWNMVSDALGWFGFSTDRKQYETVDDIVGDLCASTGLPGTSDGIKGKFSPRVRRAKKARLAPLQGDSSGLSLLTLRPTDWKNRELAGKHLLEESRRLFCIFAGRTRGDGIPTFNWEFKVTKGRVTVHGAVVPNSPWQAVKSDCIIHADKHRIRKLITDDDRSKEYDDGVDSYDLLHVVDENTRIRNYRFKAIWPTAPRDFCMLTSWVELDDGCIIVSSLSPADEYLEKKPPYVRAYLLSSGALLRPIDAKLGGGTHVSFVTHCDPGGSMPSFLINFLGTSKPAMTLGKVCEVCEAEERAERNASLARV